MAFPLLKSPPPVKQFVRKHTAIYRLRLAGREFRVQASFTELLKAMACIAYLERMGINILGTR